MTELRQVYKCTICGNMVEILHSGAGQLVCCGKPMLLLKENTEDASREKHVPVIEIEDDVVLVKIGEVPHPMEEKHHIEWIEVITETRVYRKYLKAGDKPEARFKVCKKAIEKGITAREYCNLHGLWVK